MTERTSAHAPAGSPPGHAAPRHGSARDWQTLARILREALPHRRLLGGTFAIGLLAAPLALAQPLALKVVVDSVLGSAPLPGPLGDWLPRGPDGYGGGLLVAAVLLQAIVIVLVYVQSTAHTFLQTLTGERITLAFRARLLNHVQRLSFAFHDARGTHDSIYRIQHDAPAIQQVVVFSIVSFLSAAATLVAMIVVMLGIHVGLALTAIAVLPLLFLHARLYAKRMRPRYKAAKSLESSALGVVQEVLTGFRVVKAFGREDFEEQRFVDNSSAGMRARLRLGLAEGAFGVLIGATTALGTSAVLFVGARCVQAGTLTLGELLMVFSYLAQLYGPVRTISKNVGGVQKQLASAERAFELLDERPDVQERADARPLQRARGRIEFEDVSFCYEADVRILTGISFVVEPGERIGIVGRTGAGKSTLISLLARFYDPSSGRIRLDGSDLTELRLADLRRQFSFVLQEPVLFATTIADNIAYARPEASRAEIERAAATAGAHEFIAALPDGYDTVVGERGMRLSGGERQRVSLARAFLKDAPILVLDEPTSSIDVQTEAAILQSMEQLMHGRTTFMIAHRLGTLAGCDRVFELAGGRLTVRAALGNEQVSRT